MTFIFIIHTQTTFYVSFWFSSSHFECIHARNPTRLTFERVRREHNRSRAFESHSVVGCRTRHFDWRRQNNTQLIINSPSVRDAHEFRSIQFWSLRMDANASVCTFELHILLDAETSSFFVLLFAWNEHSDCTARTRLHRCLVRAGDFYRRKKLWFSFCLLIFVRQ